MGDYQYVRNVDFAAIDDAGPTGRVVQHLLHPTNGASNCMISYAQTPPGHSSRSGNHYHDVEQIMYIVSGTMHFKVEGDEFDAGPGSLVVMPAGVRHSHGNDTNEPVVHIGIEAPLTEPGKPHSYSV